MCGDSRGGRSGGLAARAAGSEWYALVTYPSCDLITMVALPSGQIVSAAYVRATTDGDGNKNGVTLVDATTSPVCSSAACAGQALPPSAGVTSDAALRSDGAGTVDALRRRPAEAGVSDGAATATDAGGGAGGAAGRRARAEPGRRRSPGAAGASGAELGSPMPAPPADRRAGALGNQYPDGAYFGPGPLSPSGIAIVPDGSRAYISLANASFVISVGLTQQRADAAGKRHLPERGGARIEPHPPQRRSESVP